MMPLALLLALLAPAAAQDDIDLDLDDLMNEIDLSSESSAELLTYEGSAESEAPRYVAGKPVTITHTAGPVRVRCTDRDGIRARLDYTITGTSESAISRMGQGIGVRTYGGAASGSVSTRVPARPAGVTEADVRLTVSLPEQAAITVKGGRGGVQVIGCSGRVRVSNRDGGALVEGTFSSVSVSSAGGDVQVTFSEQSELSGQSTITVKGGGVELALPRGFQGRLSLRGESVELESHVVDGTEEPGRVDGLVAGGGPATVTVQATGPVRVTTP